MAIFPLDEEEKRRLALTPGFNPNLPSLPAPRRIPMITGGDPGDMARPGMPNPSSALPESPMPERLPLPTRSSMPGVEMNTPDYSPELRSAATLPQPRGVQMQTAKDEYLRGTPGRGRSALTGALESLGRGEGLIGAVAGGLTGAIAPRRLREQQFNERVRPQIAERFAYEDADRAAQRQAENDALNAQYRQAQIGELNSQAYKNRLPPPQRTPAPLRGRPGDVFLDPTTRQPIAQIPQQEKPAPKPTAPELTIEPTSGKSYEQIAEESYQSRGGDKYVFDKLPERTRRIISGQEPDVAPAEIEAANRTFQSAIDRERKSISDYTRGDVRSRALGGRKGGQTQQPSQPQGGTTRSRSQFSSKKFPGLRFD